MFLSVMLIISSTERFWLRFASHGVISGFENPKDIKAFKALALLPAVVEDGISAMLSVSSEEFIFENLSFSSKIILFAVFAPIPGAAV